MRRRQYLTLSALALTGCSGQAQKESPHAAQNGETTGDETTTSTEPRLDLPGGRTHSLGSWIEADSVRLKTQRLRTFDSVEYHSLQEESIETWDPGPDSMLVVADYRAENLTDERLDWPTWESWHLVTPDDVVEPRVETPDGTSVEEIEPSDVIVSWPESSGLRANYARGWSGVYVASRASRSALATKWTQPDKPRYWRPE